MDSQGRDRKCGVERTEAIDIIDHTEKYGWGEGCVRRETLQIVYHADAGRRAGVKPRQTAILEWDLVVEADELHKHVAD